MLKNILLSFLVVLVTCSTFVHAQLRSNIPSDAELVQAQEEEYEKWKQKNLSHNPADPHEYISVKTQRIEDNKVVVSLAVSTSEGKVKCGVRPGRMTASSESVFEEIGYSLQTLIFTEKNLLTVHKFVTESNKEASLVFLDLEIRDHQGVVISKKTLQTPLSEAQHGIVVAQRLDNTSSVSTNYTNLNPTCYWTFVMCSENGYQTCCKVYCAPAIYNSSCPGCGISPTCSSQRCSGSMPECNDF